MARIERLTVQGFRSFGREPQHLQLDSPLAIIWGPNSEGKTSLAEAFEFLLTGDIARRELLASSLDEFADALCNAHLPTGTPTFVEARLVTGDGTAHTLRRTLVSDFTKKRPCESTLELNGAPATAASLAWLGIELSEPPLSPPVLMQHTLAYLFTAKPQQRSLYFKTLLEVTDLDDLRTAIRDIEKDTQVPSNEHLGRFEACRDVPTIAPDLALLLGDIPTTTAIREAASAAAEALLTAAGKDPAADVDTRLAQLEQIVEERRSETFPLDGFRRSGDELTWEPPPDSTWKELQAYIEKLGEVDNETKRLVALFDQILGLPDVANATEAIDCPVCETRGALTPARIEAIRDSVAATAGLRSAEQRATAALRTLDSSAQSLLIAFDRTLPQFLTWDRGARKGRGFRTDRLAPLLGEADRPLLRPWFRATASLMRARQRLAGAVSEARATVSDVEAGLPTLRTDETLRAAFDALRSARAAAASTIPTYVGAAQPIASPLKSAVDVKSDIRGWADLAEVGRHPSELRQALVEQKAHTALTKELTAASKAIDIARESVLEDKFNELAGDVAIWWELLRPEEATFFSGLGLRKGGQRNIDFKVGLASDTERQNVKVRDAIAVFSQSQLHCLGLSTFFARVADGGGFLVLDDPIISIDDDYSAHFINSVLEELQTRGVQVIMLTYEQKTWRAIQERFDGGRSEAFQLNLDNPLEGTQILKTSDALSLMLKAAEPFTRSNQLSIRKDGARRIRECGERFCKELLVEKRREAGDASALITDYSGAKGNLDNLINETSPHLTESDEPGKLKLLRQLTNSGNHDDDVPSKTTLAVCRGDLVALTKKYL